MVKDIVDKINALPPLPETLIKLQEFRSKKDKEISELYLILEKDPLILATLLKVSNSAVFGFRNKVEHPKKAIELLGINFTLSIAFGAAVKSQLDTDLSAYGIDTERFLELAQISSNIVNKWIGRVDYELKEKILLASFLVNTGIFILSDILIDNNNEEQFYSKIKSNWKDIYKIEKEYFNITTPKTTALIFKHWELSSYLIDSLDNIDEENIDKAPIESKILYIITKLINPIDPLSEDAKELAIELADKFDLSSRTLAKAVEVIEDNLLG